MQRDVWKDIANKQLNRCTKVAIPCSDDHTKSKKKNWDLLENYQKYAHRMF